ncbi:MAG: hypothetical protein II054_02040 [Treponema sp.]|nr:hypothetical protein [Treponema sp.]
MKKSLALAAVFCAAMNLFAYNPPFGGENLFKVSNPELLSGASSASGGPFCTVVPGSISFNPALTSKVERTMFNASGTALVDVSDSDGYSGVGGGFQAGVILPSKWLVFTAAAEGAFSKNPLMDLGNNVGLHLGFSKDVIPSVSVGLNLYGGYYFGNGSDFTVGADLGFLYSFEKLSFLKDARLGISVLNMGKPLSSYEVTGIDGSHDGAGYPGIFTPRISFGATLFQLGSFDKRFTCAFSSDLYFPTFQNVAWDVALGFSYSDLFAINVGWDGNMREIMNDSGLSWPSVGLTMHFVIKSDSSKSGDEWKKNEIVPSVAYQNVYAEIHAISAGVSFYMGSQDDESPEIILWGDSIFDDDEDE